MKKIIVLLSVFISTILYSQTSTEVGVTEGELSVSLTGAVTY